MNVRNMFLALPIVLLGFSFSVPADQAPTFEKDVQPIIGKYCLPCHLDDTENPSGLALDTFGSMREGGENGDPVVPGNPDESILYLKLQDPPPFGKLMPRNRKSLSDQELKLIETWIRTGAAEK